MVVGISRLATYMSPLPTPPSTIMSPFTTHHPSPLSPTEHQNSLIFTKKTEGKGGGGTYTPTTTTPPTPPHPTLSERLWCFPTATFFLNTPQPKKEKKKHPFPIPHPPFQVHVHPNYKR
eukprot:Sspe_Gene.32434::Locus_15895_Transcript_1_1_Confidence_1.000_Length_545::g.32434::m.32434